MAHLNTSFPRFFAASVAIHLFFLLSWPNSSFKVPPQEIIPVSFLPLVEEVKPEPKAVPRQAPTRPSKAPAIIAKKNSPVLEEKPIAPRETTVEKARKTEAPSPPQPIQEKSVIAERTLPTLKELLPSLTWSSTKQSSQSKDTPVSLNTRDPQYMTYVSKIRQSIESVWQYPEMALRRGLQGKLALEFTILGDGRLEGLRLVRSSGSMLLDDEAMRAIRAAAPFPPIPPWIKPNPLAISASMEYRDNRLDYRFAR